MISVEVDDIVGGMETPSSPSSPRGMLTGFWLVGLWAQLLAGLGLAVLGLALIAEDRSDHSDWLDGLGVILGIVAATVGLIVAALAMLVLWLRRNHGEVASVLSAFQGMLGLLLVATLFLDGARSGLFGLVSFLAFSIPCIGWMVLSMKQPQAPLLVAHDPRDDAVVS